MRVMAIDLGDARTGVALSDLTCSITGRCETLAIFDRERLVSALCDIINEEKVTEIVLGLPLNMDGSEGDRAQKSRDFGAKLEKASGIEVKYLDERLTTVSAAAILHENGRRAGKSKIDAVAASVILEAYLLKRSHI